MKKASYLIMAILISSSIAFTLQKAPSERKVLKSLSKSFGHVPAGEVNLDGNDKSISEFYISKTEVSNKEYQEFLNALKENGENELYEVAKVDTLGWQKEFGQKLEAYSTHYHRHSAYQNYPVINVSKEGAKLYCEWLTKKTNASLSKENHLTFRLPTKAEWLRAAEGDDLKTPYTWGGPFTRNSKGVTLANFSRINDAATSRNEDGELVVEKKAVKVDKSVEYTDLTAPVNAYYPNEFGLYNMNGNVSEILADSDEVIGGSWRDGGKDIRNRSTKKYEGPSPMVGFRIVTTSIK